MGEIALWIIIALVALAVDVATTSFFFSGFAIGGIAALISQMIGAGFALQLIIFMLISAAAIAVEYLWLRTRLKSTIPTTLRMEEEYVGKVMVAEDEIGKSGKVKLGGIYWTVENEGEVVRQGEEFKITGIKGNKFIIKK